MGALDDFIKYAAEDTVNNGSGGWFPPGSSEALARGCKCAVLDNHFGKGRAGDGKKFGWATKGACPLHGWERDG